MEYRTPEQAGVRHRGEIESELGGEAGEDGAGPCVRAARCLTHKE